jgi:sterol desaturase/sphingolipid hydroxylase (fatty acid hydroxylase superfamily)
MLLSATRRRSSPGLSEHDARIGPCDPPVITTLTAFDRIGAPIVLCTVGLLLVLETLRPLRARVQARAPRWLRNGVFALAGGLIARGLVVTSVFALASLAHARGLGLLSIATLPAIVAWPLGVLLLDASMYGWHRLNHRVRFLWRFHRVHHADLDLDVSTALRFHPGELLLSLPFRAAQTLLLGPMPALALSYELLMQTATAFHHANLRLPRGFERALNALVVTPRMHQIHHSIVEDETDSNWSVVFSFWDRLARSHRDDVTEAQLVIGLPAFRQSEELTLARSAAMPFMRQRPSWQFSDGSRPVRTATMELAALAPAAGERP